MENSADTIPASGKPLEEFRQLIERLQREEVIRKALRKQEMLAALCRYVLDTHSNGSVA